MSGDLRVIRDLAGFEAIAPAWDACLTGMPAPSLFLTSAWLTSWWRAWGQDKSMDVATVTDGGELVAGAALCHWRTRYYGLPVREYKFMGEPASDRQEFLCRPGREPALELLWDHLRSMSRRYDVVRLEEIPETSATLSSSAGGRIETEPSSALPYLDNLDDWESFEKSLAYKFRSEMKTRVKVFDSWGEWSFDIVEGLPILDHLDDLGHLECESMKGAQGYALFSEPRNVAMIRNFLATGPAGGRPLLSMLRLEGRLIGYLLGFVFANKYHAYNMAFLPEYRKGSPGKWIMHNTIRHAVEMGLGEFDFLRGANYVKSRWRPKERRNARAVLFGDGPAGWLLRPAVFRVRPWIKNRRSGGQER